MKLSLIKLLVGIFLTSFVNNLQISYKVLITNINLTPKSERRILAYGMSSSMPNMRINFTDKNFKKTNQSILNNSKSANQSINQSKSLNGSLTNQSINQSKSLNGSLTNQSINQSKSLNGSQTNGLDPSVSLNGSQSVNDILSKSNYRISLKSESLFKKAVFLRRKNQDKINEILRKFTEDQNVKTELSFVLNQKTYSRKNPKDSPTVLNNEDMTRSLIIPFRKENIRSIEFILSVGQPWYLKVFGPNNDEFVQKDEFESKFDNKGSKMKFLASWMELNEEGKLRILIQCDMDVSREDFRKIL